MPSSVSSRPNKSEFKRADSVMTETSVTTAQTQQRPFTANPTQKTTAKNDLGFELDFESLLKPKTTDHSQSRPSFLMISREIIVYDCSLKNE